MKSTHLRAVALASLIFALVIARPVLAGSISCEGVGCEDASLDAVLVGRVLVKTRPDTYIYLHPIDDPDFLMVLHAVYDRKKPAIARSRVNPDRYFIIRNVRPGLYALTLNGSSMTGEWGAPMAVLVDGKGYQLATHLQGGIMQLAFSVVEISLQT